MKAVATLLGTAVLLALAPPCQGAEGAERVLTELIAGRRPLTDVAEVRFASGAAGFRGRSTLVVSGDGALTLDVDAYGRTESRTSQLEEVGLQALLQLLLETRFWALEPPPGPRPRDSELLSVRLATRAGDLEVEVRFPLTAGIDSPDCLALVEVYRALEAALLETPKRQRATPNSNLGRPSLAFRLDRVTASRSDWQLPVEVLKGPAHPENTRIPSTEDR